MPKVSFAWQIVAVAFVVAMFGWGIGFYGMPVFIHTLHKTHGWSAGLLSLAVTGHYLLSAVMVVFVSDLQRRWGLAIVTCLAVVLSGAGVMMWAFASQPWHLIPATVLTAGGWSAMNTVTISAIVSPWHTGRQPQALAMALNGASAGGIIFAPLWLGMIDGYGFGTAAVVIAGAMVLIIVPLSYSHLRRQPGAENVGRAGPGQGSVPAMISRRMMLSDRRFVTMCAAFSIGLFVQVGTFAHLLIRLAPDMGAQLASYAMSLTAISAVLGRFALAAVLMVMDRRTAAVFNFAIQIVGLLMLAFASDILVLFAGCFLFGFAVGNIITLPPLIAQAEFDGANGGRALALSTGISQGLFAMAPTVFGFAYDQLHDYMPGLVVAAGLQVVAAMIVYSGREGRS